MAAIRIATVWIEGGRLPDGEIARRVVRCEADSDPAFRAQADAQLATEFQASIHRDIQLSFGPIGEPWTWRL